MSAITFECPVTEYDVIAHKDNDENIFAINPQCLVINMMNTKKHKTMAKVITFSRYFHKSHPKAGEPTYFVEKILNSLNLTDLNKKPLPDLNDFFIVAGDGKNHTIRSGSRFKAGDKFSPRVWSGKPYTSKQIAIAPDVEVKKVWNFSIDENGIYSINGKCIDEKTELILAKNDGLSQGEMMYWFMPSVLKPKPFHGQIICWSDNVSY